ncbi:MAG: hypothetical protein KDK91_34145 [Gammaproteobacteria bacterium]|nr:hypothetical protein [Gammaproteobacteria bacterium]
MATEVTLVEAIVGALGALGTALSSWALLTRASTESRSKSAEVQSAAAMQLTQQQGQFTSSLISRVSELETTIKDERVRCDERVNEERARCDGELEKRDSEIGRIRCELVKIQRGHDAKVRHDDPR